MRLVEAGSGRVVAENLELFSSSWSRFVGLMGSPEPERGRGFWLEPCNSIHTFFMRFSIDVLFLDRQRKVKKVTLDLKPWRLSPIVFGARSVVELPAGTLSDQSLVGASLVLE
jgi:uncharacterized membrane protein (UPF0127 family)